MRPFRTVGATSSRTAHGVRLALHPPCTRRAPSAPSLQPGAAQLAHLCARVLSAPNVIRLSESRETILSSLSFFCLVNNGPLVPVRLSRPIAEAGAARVRHLRRHGRGHGRGRVGQWGARGQLHIVPSREGGEGACGHAPAPARCCAGPQLSDLALRMLDAVAQSGLLDLAVGRSSHHNAHVCRERPLLTVFVSPCRPFSLAARRRRLG